MNETINGHLVEERPQAISSATSSDLLVLPTTSYVFKDNLLVIIENHSLVLLEYQQTIACARFVQTQTATALQS